MVYRPHTLPKGNRLVLRFQLRHPGFPATHHLTEGIGQVRFELGSGALELIATGFARFLPVYRKVAKLEPAVKLGERTGAG